MFLKSAFGCYSSSTRLTALSKLSLSGLALLSVRVTEKTSLQFMGCTVYDADMMAGIKSALLVTLPGVQPPGPYIL